MQSAQSSTGSNSTGFDDQASSTAITMTEEAIKQAQYWNWAYCVPAILLCCALLPAVVRSLLTSYRLTKRRIFVCLVPSPPLLVKWLVFALKAYMIYFGLSIHIIGFHINIRPTVQPTCEAAEAVFGRSNIICDCQTWKEMFLYAFSSGNHTAVTSSHKSVALTYYILALVYMLGTGLEALTTRRKTCQGCGHRVYGQEASDDEPVWWCDDCSSAKALAKADDPTSPFARDTEKFAPDMVSSEDTSALPSRRVGANSGFTRQLGNTCGVMVGFAVLLLCLLFGSDLIGHFAEA